MSSVSDIIAWVTWEICLLIPILCLYLRESYALDTNSTYPQYRVIPLGQDHSSSDNVEVAHKNIIPISSENMHAHKLVQTANMIDIHWLNSTTDSISIRWEISEKYTISGYIRESVVEYLQQEGKFSSLPLDPSVKEYTFRNLDVDTTYTICAYMIEIYGENNESSITHSRCVKINTIEYIRRDSVIVVMLTVGYYLFMGILGYTQWKRRCWEIEKRNRAMEIECNSKVDKYAMRWKDLEQREKLMTKAGCSIETNDT